VPARVDTGVPLGVATGVPAGDAPTLAEAALLGAPDATADAVDVPLGVAVVDVVAAPV